MLALKKQRQAEAAAREKEKARAEAAAAAEASSSNAPTTKKINLIGIGGKQGKAKSENGATQGKKRTPGEIRIQKDIADLDAGSLVTIDFPNPNDLTSFNVSITPDSGYWMGATYLFSFNVPSNYPHSPPKVLCQTKIYHPNINLEGNVCLNILRDDWKPVLDINAVIEGLLYLLYDPNPNDPLNQEAAELLRRDKKSFGHLVKRTLTGGLYKGESFQKLI